MKKLIFIHILILFFLGNAVFARAGDYDEMDYGQFDDSAEQYADEEYYEDPYLYDDYN